MTAPKKMHAKPDVTSAFVLNLECIKYFDGEGSIKQSADGKCLPTSNNVRGHVPSSTVSWAPPAA